MLGNYEIQRPTLTLNVNQANFSDLTGVSSLFLVTPSFTLATTTMLTSTAWVNGIAAKSIIPIHDIKDVQDETEQPDIKESKQNFRYQARQGKYRFTFLLNIDVDQFIKLKKYEGQNLKAYFADRNGNLIGRVVSTTFYPFTLSSIMVFKIGFGRFESSYVGINIDLAYPNEMEQGYSFKPDFSIKDLVNETVDIESLTAVDTTTMQFEVYDGCNNAITDLVAADFTIVDELLGTLTLNTFTNVGDGVYTYKTDEVQYLGTITLTNTKYNGQAIYEFIEPEFSPVDFSSDFKIT